VIGTTENAAKWRNVATVMNVVNKIGEVQRIPNDLEKIDQIGVDVISLL
jgi:hypothetical protein